MGGATRRGCQRCRRATTESKHPLRGPRTEGDNGNKTALELISPRGGE